MIIMSKLFPVGIEATMYCFTMTVFMAVGAFFPVILGVWINNTFIHCTTENMDNFVYLKLVRLVMLIICFSFLGFVPTLDEVNTVYKAN